MRQSKRFGLTLGLTGLLTIGAALPALAQNKVTQSITGGIRTASVAALTLSPMASSFSDQPSTGTMTLTADDSSGTGLGWNVTILSSDFAYAGANGGTAIPAVNFSITTANPPARTAGQAIGAGGPNVPALGATGTLDTAHKTIQALLLYGKGTYTQAEAVSLNVPALSLAGTYTGTLTTTISAAP